jgi:hypothetical protein
MDLVSELFTNAVTVIGVMNDRMDDPLSWVMLGVIVALARIAA